MKPKTNFILSSALLIVGCAFLGWGIAWVTGAPNAAQSSATGWGLGAGAVVAAIYWLRSR